METNISMFYHSSYDKCDICGERNYYNMDIWNVHSNKLKKVIYSNKSKAPKDSDSFLRICGNCAYTIMKASLFNLKSERNDVDFINDLKILIKVLEIHSKRCQNYSETNEKIKEYFNSQIYENSGIVQRIIENSFKDSVNRNHDIREFIEKYVSSKKMKIGGRLNEMEMLFILGMIWNEISQNLNLTSIIEINPHKFPDIVAIRKKNGIISEVNIELERSSIDFLSHGHSIDNCNMLICWKHNWIECPEHIEVLEMSKIIDKSYNIT